MHNPQIEFNFIKNNIINLPEKGIIIINDHAKEKKVTSNFPYWLLKENNKNYRIIRLNDFLESKIDLINKYPIILYQGVTFFSFHSDELMAKGFSEDEIKEINSTYENYERESLSNLKKKYNFIKISDESFNSTPYGFEIVPQKKITIGFYFLNER